jgi:outer membrane protein insertion porin family
VSEWARRAHQEDQYRRQHGIRRRNLLRFPAQHTDHAVVLHRCGSVFQTEIIHDLETLRSYYLTAAISISTSIPPGIDHAGQKGYLLTITITEGDQYKVKEVRMAGDLVVEPAELFPLVQLNSAMCSRKRVTETVRRSRTP